MAKRPQTKAPLKRLQLLRATCFAILNTLSSENGCCFRPYISAAKLHERFMTILNEITLPEKYIDLFQLQLRKIFTTINAEKEETAKLYKTKLTELEQKIENLEERYIEKLRRNYMKSSPVNLIRKGKTYYCGWNQP